MKIGILKNTFGDEMNSVAQEYNIPCLNELDEPEYAFIEYNRITFGFAYSMQNGEKIFHFINPVTNRCITTVNADGDANDFAQAFKKVFAQVQKYDLCVPPPSPQEDKNMANDKMLKTYTRIVAKDCDATKFENGKLLRTVYLRDDKNNDTEYQIGEIIHSDFKVVSKTYDNIEQSYLYEILEINTF